MENLSPAAHLDRIRATLTEHYQWSLFDFMPKPEPFRVAHIDQLLKNIGTPSDLTRLVRDGEREVIVFVEHLDWDSRFFGYPIVRIQGVFPLTPPFDDLSVNYAAMLRYALDDMPPVRYLFASVLPEDLPTMRSLSQNGFDLIETRAIYHRPLGSFNYPHRFKIRSAHASDVSLLADVAHTTVNIYDRFHADPAFDSQTVDRLMREWIRASIESGFADAVFVPDVDAPKGFCTVNFHEDMWDTWGIALSQTGALGAVAPAARGWYLKLVAEITYRLKERGAAHAYIKTQITNRAVIRVWEHLGYQFGRGEHIFSKRIPG